MKKVIILTNYFPPNNITAANRPYSWYLHLKELGYYPVVFTKICSNEHAKTTVTNSEIGEIHYINYKDSWFEKLNNYFQNNNILILKQLFLFLFYALQYYSKTVRNSKELETYTNEYCKKNRDIAVCIATGNPFWLFQIALNLKTQFKIPFIADYRDPWSNNDQLYKYLFAKIIRKLDARIEKKISLQYDAIIAVSDYQKNEIAKHLNYSLNKSYVLYNGFLGDCSISNTDYNSFIVLFSGIVYPDQPIETFIDIYINLFKNNELPINSKFVFLGIKANLEPFNRIKKAIVGYEKLFELTDRLLYSQAIEYQKSASVFIMPTHNNLKGIPSSKLFDYVSLNKPILAYPNDEDVIEEILIRTKLGLIANTEKKLESNFKLIVQKFIEKCPIVNGDIEAIKEYSRKNQCKVLQKVINEINS